MDPRIFMIGWELPPNISGGLGVACYGLAKALSEKGAKINFVLPKKADLDIDFMNLIFADMKEIRKLKSSYPTSSDYLTDFEKVENKYRDFVNAALSYGEAIRDIAKKYQDKTDIIHSHDWLTYPAAIAAKKIMNKPLVSHVHSTEFDRTGGHFPNQYVYHIEKEGLNNSDRIISISNLQKDILMNMYDIKASKIEVVHNGIGELERPKLPPALLSMKQLGYKVILYLGRITLQKGPEYFIRAAKIVSEYNPKVIFVVTGGGDMQEKMMLEAADLGILEKTIFTGFLNREEVNRIYQASDLYVMPSVSEPFGLTSLESIMNGTPVLISKQSGASEVIKNALKVDFWDVEEIANKMLAVVDFDPLKADLIAESKKELYGLTWDKAADKCMNLYRQFI